ADGGRVPGRRGAIGGRLPARSDRDRGAGVSRRGARRGRSGGGGDGGARRAVAGAVGSRAHDRGRVGSRGRGGHSRGGGAGGGAEAAAVRGGGPTADGRPGGGAVDRPGPAARPAQGDDQPVSLVLGLDIGGSRTRGRVCSDGRVVAEASGPSASLAAAGAERAAEVLGGLLVSLGRPSVAAAVAGAAGCDTAAGRSRMLELLGPLLPGARVEVVHDTRLVLAAAGLDSGIVLIA